MPPNLPVLPRKKAQSLSRDDLQSFSAIVANEEGTPKSNTFPAVWTFMNKPERQLRRPRFRQQSLDPQVSQHNAINAAFRKQNNIYQPISVEGVRPGQVLPDRIRPVIALDMDECLVHTCGSRGSRGPCLIKGF